MKQSKQTHRDKHKKKISIHFCVKREREIRVRAILTSVSVDLGHNLSTRASDKMFAVSPQSLVSPVVEHVAIAAR